MEAGEGARLHPDAVLHALVAEVGAPLPRRDGHAARGPGAETHLAVAHEDDRPDVALAETIRAHGVEARGHQLLAPIRDGQIEDVRGAVQPVDVLAQAEDCRATVVAFVATDAL